VHQRTEIELMREGFLNEPVCQTIIGWVSDLPLTARSHHSDYPHIRLDDTTSVELGVAVSRHYPEFKTRLLAYVPQMRQKDLQICYLYLLGLNDFQIALLLQCHNSTIFRRATNMQKAFGTDIPMSDFVKKLAIS
ncbi:MAG: hypothetical protein IKX24_07895, partial [Prevotella sp.]|nr:hypothetical protein [Prevotella sp.]